MKKIALSLLVIAASGAYVWSQAATLPADALIGPMAAQDQLPAGSDPIRAALMATAAPAPAAVQAPAQAAFVAPEALPLRRSVRPTEDDESDDGLLPAPAVIVGSAPTLPAEHLSPPNELVPPLVVAEAALPVVPAAAAAVSPLADAVAVPAPADTGAADAPANAPPPAPDMQPIAVDVPLPRPRPAPPVVPARLATQVATRMASAGGYSDGVYTGPVVDAFYGLVQVQAVVQGGRITGVKVLQFPSHRRTSVWINQQALPMLGQEVVQAQSANVDIISGATLTSEAYIRSLSVALRQGAA